MTSCSRTNVWSLLLGGTAVTLIILLGLLRFVHLDADFPAGLTWSGELYTDEGWYSSAAINHHLTGKWLLEGDFNPVVNMPVFHLVQAAVFSVFGMSLQTARCTSACFSLALFVLLYLFAKQYIPRPGAALCVLLLASNYICFAYSRLALLELPMLTLIVLSLYIGSCLKMRRNILVVLLSACVLVLAILLKNTAIFSIPILMYVLGRRGTTRTNAIVYAVMALIVVSSLVVSYNEIMSLYYSDDYSYFKNINIDKRISYDIKSVLDSAKNVDISLRGIDPILYCMSIWVVLILPILSSEFRNNALVRISIVWIICYLTLLSVTFYHPLRYFIPLIIPCAMMIGTAVTIHTNILDIDRQRFVLLGVLIIVIGMNLFTICDYMRNLKYSFKNMCYNINKIVDYYSTPGHSKILLGNFAHSISIETGLRGINTNGTRDLAWRVSQYRPGFYISLEEEKGVLDTLAEMYELQPLCPFDVFENYSKKRQVWFFKLLDQDRQ